jgi:hypothetical protein
MWQGFGVSEACRAPGENEIDYQSHARICLRGPRGQYQSPRQPFLSPMIHCECECECEFVAVTGRAVRGGAVAGKARGPGAGRVQAVLSALDHGLD